MIQRAVNRSRPTRGGMTVSCVLHALLLLLLFYQIGRQTGLVRDYDELTEIAYIEARYGEDVAAKVKMKTVPTLNPQLENSARGVATDSAFKPKQPTPDPPRPEPKPAMAEAEAPQIKPQTKTQLRAFAEQLTGKTPEARQRPIIETSKLKTSGADAVEVVDGPAPRVAKLAEHGAFKPKASALQGRAGKIIVTDGPAGISGGGQTTAGVVDAPADLAGGSLQSRRGAYEPAKGALNPKGSRRSSGGQGVLDVTGPSGTGGASKGRKTILDYGSGNGGRGGGLSGRGTKLIEAPGSQTIVDKQRSGGPSAEKQTKVAEAKLNGKGIRMSISGQIEGREILESAAPVYSEKAKRNGWEGAVAVHFTVLASGRVKDNVYFEQTSAHRDLNRAAMDAIKKFRFAPLPASQAAVEQWGVITMVFRLR